MKNTLTRALLCIVFSLVCSVPAFSQVNDDEKTGILNHTWRTVRSTQGTDFWVTFMRNSAAELKDKSLALQLRVTTMETEATVTVSDYYNSCWPLPCRVLYSVPASASPPESL